MDTREITNIKNISDVQRVMNANQVVWQGGTPLKDLPIGSKVVDPNTKYYGQPIVWIIADKNHEGYPANTVTLISEKILCLKAFDAREPNNTNELRRDYGNNNYEFSNLLQWLNSDKANWYSPRHEVDAPPKYNAEPGFLSNFSSDFKKVIVTSNLKTVMSNIDGGGSKVITSKIFLASLAEIGLRISDVIEESVKFPIFSDNNSRLAYPTEDVVAKNSNFNTSSVIRWWTRTVTPSSKCGVLEVHSKGSTVNNADFISGVRPLCNVKDSSTFFEVIK